jgi:glycine/D-amino acid oxidase-like deaminating enzyme
MSAADTGPSVWQDEEPRHGRALSGEARADVAIIGGGYTGLWTALLLKERDPSLRVTIVESARIGFGASGRNGGFVDPSLTHGIANGAEHFPDEQLELVRLGRENYQAMERFVREQQLDCDWEPVGKLDVALEPWQLDDLEEERALYDQAGEHVELLDAAATRREVDSPTFLGGLHRPEGGAMVDPAFLAHELARVAVERGVIIHEDTPVTAVRRDGDGVRLRTTGGSLAAPRAVLATNAYSHRLIRRTGRWYVPVHDYVLATAPLTPEQRDRIGWRRRQGLSDSANQFHYYRLTPDDRILWGGYDAIYRFGNGVGPDTAHRPRTYALLERQFRQTFPQLDDVPFERRWGGPIATTTRFTVAFGDELGGRVLWALGYTGLGVATARFGGLVLTERLLETDSELLRLKLTSTKPFPFPPEPLRWIGVNLTRRAIARADRRRGRRGLWLRVLDWFGIGFNS